MSNGYHLDKTTRKKNKMTIAFMIEEKRPVFINPHTV